MRVVEVTDFGGPEVLHPAERPMPEPSPREVLVRVRAANVNPADLAARSGRARRRLPDLTPPFVVGWDLAGEVVAAGDRVAGYAAGDRVVGMIPWLRIDGRIGAYAEAVAVQESWLAPIAEGIDDVVSATLPLNALTARQALDLIAAPAGATILITGASGAVGGFATQLAARDGIRVLAVASHGDEQWVAGLGAAEVVGRDTDLASLGPMDAALDAVPIGQSAADAVRDAGTVVFTRSVADLERADRLRVEAPLARPDPAALRALAAELCAGRLRTRVAETPDLGEAAGAHRLLEAGGLRGKIVLIP